LKIRSYLDPETGGPHIYGHGVTAEEVKDVLSSPGEDRLGREASREAIGQKRSERYLRVNYVPDPELDSAFVITAYEFVGKALTATDGASVERVNDETEPISAWVG